MDESTPVIEAPIRKRNRANRNDPRWENTCRCGLYAEVQCDACGHGVCREHENWFNVWEYEGDVACQVCYKRIHWHGPIRCICSEKPLESEQ